MIANIVWWSAILLEAVLLVRSLRGGLLRTYPFFFTYISCVFLTDVLLIFVYLAHRGIYPQLWWFGEFLSVGAGYAVIIEMYKRSLASYAGVARIAEFSLVALLTVVVIGVLAKSLGVTGPMGSFMHATVALDRDLRISEAALLFVLGLFLAYYEIPLSRSLKGLIFGYGLYVGVAIPNLAFRLEGRSAALMTAIEPIAYLMTLVIWCVSLWSFQQETAVEPEIVEQDYEALGSQTRLMLFRARNYVTRAIRI